MNAGPCAMAHLQAQSEMEWYAVHVNRVLYGVCLYQWDDAHQWFCHRTGQHTVHVRTNNPACNLQQNNCWGLSNELQTFDKPFPMELNLKMQNCN